MQWSTVEQWEQEQTVGNQLRNSHSHQFSTHTTVELFACDLVDTESPRRYFAARSCTTVRSRCRLHLFYCSHRVPRLKPPPFARVLQPLSGTPLSLQYCRSRTIRPMSLGPRQQGRRPQGQRRRRQLRQLRHPGLDALPHPAGGRQTRPVRPPCRAPAGGNGSRTSGVAVAAPPPTAARTGRPQAAGPWT